MAKAFKLTKNEEELRKGVYDDIEHMIEVRSKTYPHFNGENGDRDLIAYINDSDHRLNSSTPSRDAQGKEDWQSNLFNPVTRNKMKALIAGIALSVPDQKFSAVNKEGLNSAQRAEVMKQLVRHSRLQGNPQLEMFFEAWECAAKGTVVKYDGYLKTKYKRKFIKSYDLTSGQIEFDEREEVVDDRPIDLLVPLQEFFIWDFNIFDVQDQPKLAWIKHYDKEALEMEFGQYRNFSQVKDKETIKRFDSTVQSSYLNKWADRVKDKDDFEVIRYFNKLQDRYEIWANGVPLLIAPLVWGRAKKKYPFSKTMFEPFVNGQFFYGKSFPSTIEGIQDVDNTLINSILDKAYRSLVPPMLVGLGNKDLFDIESELVNQDNKIYVPDVNQVKPMPFNGVSSGEIAMLQYVARLGDLASLDANQQGIQGKGVTAREILVANENARKLKGIFFMFLEDLWLQKTRLRIVNVLMNYTKPRAEKIAGKKAQVFNVPDAELPDGSIGTIGIQMAESENDMLSVPEIEAREDVMARNGVNYKLVSVKSTYLDDWDYDVSIVTDSFANQDKAERQARFQEKMQLMAAIFPEYLAANKERLFKEFAELNDEVAEDYQKPAPPKDPLADMEGGPLQEGQELLAPAQPQ